jgi:hypothetical protein
MRCNPLFLPRLSVLQLLIPPPAAPSLLPNGLIQRRIESDEELIVRVSELAVVDPGREGGEEGNGESLEEAGGEGRDERVAIGGVGVEGGEEGATDVVAYVTGNAQFGWRGKRRRRK